jgi:hypothetical protein
MVIAAGAIVSFTLPCDSSALPGECTPVVTVPISYTSPITGEVLLGDGGFNAADQAVSVIWAIALVLAFTIGLWTGTRGISPRVE